MFQFFRVSPHLCRLVSACLVYRMCTARTEIVAHVKDPVSTWLRIRAGIVAGGRKTQLTPNSSRVIRIMIVPVPNEIIKVVVAIGGVVVVVGGGGGGGEGGGEGAVGGVAVLQSPRLTVIRCPCFVTNVTGLPMTHGLRVFDALEPKFTPFKFALCMELTH